MTEMLIYPGRYRPVARKKQVQALTLFLARVYNGYNQTERSLTIKQRGKDV